MTPANELTRRGYSHNLVHWPDLKTQQVRVYDQNMQVLVHQSQQSSLPAALVNIEMHMAPAFERVQECPYWARRRNLSYQQGRIDIDMGRSAALQLLRRPRLLQITLFLLIWGRSLTERGPRGWRYDISRAEEKR